MSTLNLDRPIVLAPMAGGPSTPELCASVSNAGGLGFLAGGYRAVDDLAEDIAATARLTDRPFGVNLFAPPPSAPPEAEALYDTYRQTLLDAGEATADELPTAPEWGDDDYEAKIELAADGPASWVSVTFGHPSREVIDHLHDAGKTVVLYATSRSGIDAVARSGADVIGLQGPDAGGHRASTEYDDDTDTPLRDLIVHAREICSLPVIAGGGIRDASDVSFLLDVGATAVQVGTLFLTTTEAGTKPTHRRALLELADRPTSVTTSFTGRPARAITNSFIISHPDAPGLYPALHHLTAPMRSRAARDDDVEHLNLWAGTGFPSCRVTTAAELVESLTPR